MENTNSNKPQVQVIIDHPIKTSQEITNLDSAKTVRSYVLTSLHAGYFRITLSFGSQALLWKTLMSSESDGLWNVYNKLPSITFFLLWCIALVTLSSLSLLYILKCVFHFDTVKAEFLHHIGVNYLYAPSASWLLLLQSAPMISPNNILYQILFGLFAIPILTLDIKIYGQWFTTEKRFLSVMANPTSQVSAIANLVAARAAAQMGWRESAVFLFSLGMVHYLVIFVTLYQRLSGGSNFPATLKPAFFLFFAAPSMASLAWNSISGSFDTAAKMLFFLSIFIFTSLVCRPTLFKKSMKKFSVAWWAYSFPLAFLALASAEYAQEAKGHAAPGLMLSLSSLSVLVFLGLILLTAANSDRLLRESDPIFTSAINTKQGRDLVYNRSTNRSSVC